MRYLVTGGAGFIGNAVALRLVADGHDVVVLDDCNDYYDVGLKESRLARLPEHVPVICAGIEELETLRELFAAYKFDAVCHLAAQAGVRYSLEAPARYIESNYVGTFRVLEVMREFGVKRLVYASSSSVYGEDDNVPFREDVRADRTVSVYAATKRAGELLVHTYHHLYDFDVTTLRFFTVYGPWGRPDMAPYIFTDKILAGEPITVFNEGNMRRDFTYIDDIVDGVVNALERVQHYAVYNLGYGQPVALMDFIAAVEDAAGVRAKIEYAPMQPGDVTQTYADTTAATHALDYRPRTPVTRGVAEYIAWFRDYYQR
jgi:UDP-glucuronate 4-epimerase